MRAAEKRELRPVLDALFPPRGPCAFCGDDEIGARHRLIDSIAENVRAGDPVPQVMDGYEVTWDQVQIALKWTARVGAPTP